MLLSANISTAQLTNKNEKEMNWNNIQTSTFYYINNIKKNFYENNYKSEQKVFNNKLESKESFKIVENKALKYIQRFQKENISANQSINTLVKENSDFAKKFNENKNEINQSIFHNNLSITRFKTDNIKQNLNTNSFTASNLNEFISNLRLAKAISATIAASAAIAAAAFWAASWWTFGVFIPFATACTIISTTAAFINIILTNALNKYNVDFPGWRKVGNWIGFSAKIRAFLLNSVLGKTLKYTKGVFSNFSWAFSAVGNIFSVIEAICSWIDYIEG